MSDDSDPGVTLAAPRTADPMSAPPVRWGILGSGMIAGAFAHGLRHGTQQQLVAVGSRTLARAEEFAAANGGVAACGSYEELVAADVDIVYVATPHSEHREHALLALDAGKAVLVEKAFTRNAAEARDVRDRAAEGGLFVMEAMWSRFLPHYDVVRQAVASGLLGDIHTVFADHGQLLWPDGPQRLSDPALAGGALLDLGIYPVQFAAMVLGTLRGVRARGTLTPEGVDAQVSILATNADGAHAVLDATMAAKTPTTAVVCGSRARLEIDGDFYGPGPIRLVDPDGTVLDRYEGNAQEGHFGLRYEAAEAARCITDGRTESELMPIDETLRVMELLDEVRAQIGVRYPGE